MRLTLSFILLFVLFLTAADDIGNFNIDKVRKQRGESTQVADSLMESTETDKAPSPFILVLRIIGSLVFLSLIIYGIVFGIKKSGILKKAEELPEGSFELLEKFVTNKQGAALLMVRCEKSVLILGHTSENITLLKTVEGDEALALIDSKEGERPVTGFQASLNGFITSMKREGKNG